MQIYDTVIVGGGPAGITAALYTLRAGNSVAWVEKMAPGGQVLLTEWIDNYPGFPQGIKGYELVDIMAAHLDNFSFDKYTEEVKSITPDPAGHNLQVGRDWIQAKSVILATGAEHSKLGLDREDELMGRGVSYCGLCDGNFFRDQEIVCIGGGNTALEESLYLSKLAKKVYLVHRRDKFRGDKIYQDKVIEQPNIEILYNKVPKTILGENDVQGLEVQDVQTKETSSLDVNGIFIFVGIKPITEFLPDFIQTDRAGFVVTDTEMRTNVQGIYAAGDVRSKLCRQVTTAVGDGATAANAANVYMQEQANV